MQITITIRKNPQHVKNKYNVKGYGERRNLLDSLILLSE